MFPISNEVKIKPNNFLKIYRLASCDFMKAFRTGDNSNDYGKTTKQQILN